CQYSTRAGPKDTGGLAMTYRTRNRSTESQEKAAAFRQMAARLDGELKTGQHEQRLRKAQKEVQGLERYSDLNRLLIITQCPSVTEVHGYEEWKQYGMQVRKGEKGIAIRAPHTRQGREGEEGNKGVGFHRTYVFDRSQVDPITEQQPEEAAYVRSLGENED